MRKFIIVISGQRDYCDIIQSSLAVTADINLISGAPGNGRTADHTGHQFRSQHNGGKRHFRFDKKKAVFFRHGKDFFLDTAEFPVVQNKVTDSAPLKILEKRNEVDNAVVIAVYKNSFTGRDNSGCLSDSAGEFSQAAGVIIQLIHCYFPVSGSAGVPGVFLVPQGALEFFQT
ncbi:MAG: hypothetical protein IJ252_06005 [Solobacterium sp.]|nr:hypothetical protein [Solobacterium sp.]